MNVFNQSLSTGMPTNKMPKISPILENVKISIAPN